MGWDQLGGSGNRLLSAGTKASRGRVCVPDQQVHPGWFLRGVCGLGLEPAVLLPPTVADQSTSQVLSRLEGLEKVHCTSGWKEGQTDIRRPCLRREKHHACFCNSPQAGKNTVSGGRLAWVWMLAPSRGGCVTLARTHTFCASASSSVRRALPSTGLLGESGDAVSYCSQSAESRVLGCALS